MNWPSVGDLFRAVSLSTPRINTLCLLNLGLESGHSIDNAPPKGYTVGCFGGPNKCKQYEAAHSVKRSFPPVQSRARPSVYVQ